MKKIIIITLAMLAITGSAASAQVYSISEIQRDFTDGIVTVKGLADANDEVTLRVRKAGLDSETPEEYFALSESLADAEGKLVYRFIPKDMTSGQYEILISTDKSENIKAGFFYGDDESIQKTVDALNNSKSADEIEKILTNSDMTEEEQINHVGNLFLDNNVFNGVNKYNIAAKLDGFFEERKNADEIRSRIMNISLLECYNEGRKDIVADSKNTFMYDDITELSKIDSKYSITAYDEYFKLKDSGKANVINNLMNKGFDTFEDMYKAFAEAVCIEGIKNYSQEGYGHVDALLTKNGAYISLDLSVYDAQSSNMKNKIAAYLVKNSALISSKPDIEKYIKKAVEENTKSSSTGNSGNKGSSGGGGSIGGVASDTLPATQATDVKTVSYTDLNDTHWAYEAIVSVSKREIFAGDANGNFRPNDFIKREEFIKAVVNTFNIYDKDAKCSFSDVSENSWYASYVASAVNAGIVKGITEDKFGTGLYITREDAAVLLSRTITSVGKTLTSKSEAEFTDANDISDYAKEHVNIMSAAGIISGMGDGTFVPKGNCTRAQAATVIYNIIKALKL